MEGGRLHEFTHVAQWVIHGWPQAKIIGLTSVQKSHQLLRRKRLFSIARIRELCLDRYLPSYNMMAALPPGPISLAPPFEVFAGRTPHAHNNLRSVYLRSVYQVRQQQTS